MSTDQAIGHIREVVGSGSNKPFFVYLSLMTKYVHRRRSTVASIIKSRKENIAEMDSSVGSLVRSLKQEGVYDNTIIIFLSDNGGMFIEGHTGDRHVDPNFPYKGYKGTIYEGGTKVPGFIHSPLIGTSGHRYEGLMHMVDIMPTILSAAGYTGSLPSYLDGVDQWKAITEHLESPRHHRLCKLNVYKGKTSLVKTPFRQTMVYNIDDDFVPSFQSSIIELNNNRKNYQIAIRVNNYKLIWGRPGGFVSFYKNHKLTRKGVAFSGHKLELYDLAIDPTEKINIAPRMKNVVNRMKDFAQMMYKQVFEFLKKEGKDKTWCKAVKNITCRSFQNSKLDSETYDQHTTLMETYQGTFIQEPRVCRVQFERTSSSK